MKEILVILKFGGLIYLIDLCIDMKYWYGMPNFTLLSIVFIISAIWLTYIFYKAKLKTKAAFKYLYTLILVLMLSKLFTNGDVLFDLVNKFTASKVNSAKIILGIGLCLILEPISLKLLDSNNKGTKDFIEILDL